MIKSFECMLLEFIFWEGDDEFASQANILFDSNITDFIHEETVVLIAGELIRRLSEEMYPDQLFARFKAGCFKSGFFKI